MTGEETEAKTCPLCGGRMLPLYSVIGGFPGHPHIHPGPLWGHKCEDCSYKRRTKRDRGSRLRIKAE